MKSTTRALLLALIFLSSGLFACEYCDQVRAESQEDGNVYVIEIKHVVFRKHKIIYVYKGNKIYLRCIRTDSSGYFFLRGDIERIVKK